MSKNTLTVGATDPSGQVPALSSRGPAYDGRIKPELVAYGEGGSSEAAALVSGISVLLQQQYRDQHAGTLPPAALVKAVLLNSADDLGRPEVDFVSGFGQADALGRHEHHARRPLFRRQRGAGQPSRYSASSVPAGQQQLKATLVWSDPEAAANAAPALVNDLDLELVAVGTGQRWRPWVLSAYPHADSLALPARRGADHLNNVEQITLALPAAGTYELHVRGYAVPQGPQAFSLAYEVSAPGLDLDCIPCAPITCARYHHHPALAVERPGRRHRPPRIPPRGPARAGSVLTAAVPLAANRFTWAVPDTTTLAQLRLVSGSRRVPVRHVCRCARARGAGGLRLPR